MMSQDTLSSTRRASAESNKTGCGSRFTLRKRPIRKDRDSVNLSSYNSDFLSGLFADVAKANVLSELGISQKRSSEHITTDPSEVSGTESSVPNKKSRVTSCGSLIRVGASSTNLADLTQIHSPKGINEFFGPSQVKPSLPRKGLKKSHHHDSLAFQLNCVSGGESSDSISQRRHPSVGDAARVAFPNLPATVSDSSCVTGLTRANLVQQVASPENETKDTFGWFVDLDDNQTPEAPAGLPYTVSCDDLAFQAPTAPLRSNNDDEVEWAKAADTVDDVLGDFF